MTGISKDDIRSGLSRLKRVFSRNPEGLAEAIEGLKSVQQDSDRSSFRGGWVPPDHRR